MITVTKVVKGPVPAGTTFTVSVQCTGGSFKGGPVIITFDEHGTLTSGTNVVDGLPATITCTATETVTGGATVTYACATEGNDETDQDGSSATCPSGATGNVIHFSDVIGDSGTVQVTNTFTAPPTPPTEPAAEVVVTPALTG
jgi:hypothetical protein